MALRWKVVLVVSGKDGDYTRHGLKALADLGFEERHVFCARGVKVPSSENVIRHRTEAETELDLWRDTIESMAGFAHDTDLFLLTTPDLDFWEHLRIFVEATNEPDFVGIYLPFTPPNLWMDDEPRTLSCSGEFGWCEQQVTAMTAADRCIIANNRTLPLLSYHLHRRIWPYSTWSPVFAECVGRAHRLPTFFAKTSLAKRTKTEHTLEIASARFSPETAQDTNYYLPAR